MSKITPVNNVIIHLFDESIFTFTLYKNYKIFQQFISSREKRIIIAPIRRCNRLCRWVSWYEEICTDFTAVRDRDAVISRYHMSSLVVVVVVACNPTDDWRSGTYHMNMSSLKPGGGMWSGSGLRNVNINRTYSIKARNIEIYEGAFSSTSQHNSSMANAMLR